MSLKPSAVVMPADRSTKNPATGFCRNPKCQEQLGELFRFPIEHAHVSCPKCGANRTPMVGVFALVHLVLPLEGGKIRGAGGISLSLACDPDRDYLATRTNNEAASDDIEAVNCPQCIANAKKLGIVQQVNKLWTPGG